MKPVAYDILRLLLGPFSETPRGIDRIDLGCALHLLKDESLNCIGLLPTPWATRWFRREHILEYETFFERMWGEIQTSKTDVIFERVRSRLLGAPKKQAICAPRSKHMQNLRGLWRFYAMLLQNSWSIGRSSTSLPNGSLYLNIGQLSLSRPALLKWLDSRRDIRSIFMVHDVIPLSHPNIVSSGNTKLHERLMINAIQYGHMLLTPSEAAREAVEEEIAKRGAGRIPVRAVPLPINDIFLTQEAPDPDLARHPYFVICGTVEKRKNHILILNAWRALENYYGSDTPKLVICGSLGWGSEVVLRFLGDHPEVRRHVIMAEGISTVGVKRLMANARAVLTPSFAEGFGLPPIEALATGTPSLLSNIPSHREGAGSFGIFLEPDELEAWIENIVRLTENDEAYSVLRRTIANFRPNTWARHCDKLKGAMCELE